VYADSNFIYTGDYVGEAERLFIGFMPKNVQVSIEETHCRTMHRFIYRAIYTSPTSGRTMCVTAKGDSLPIGHDDIFRFYLRQLTLEPSEVRLEFSRIYFMERRAKQDEWLFGSGNNRVAGKAAKGEDGAMIADSLKYGEFV
jgi:hypothetical protein